jgi:hypothetical protein
MHSTEITTRLTRRLFGAPLLRNSIRGEWVEEMVAVALEPEWALCAGDWGACDLAQLDGPLRIQVKQSAARQSWHGDASPPPRPIFSIAHKAGRHEPTGWIAERSRNAELFIFAWHPVTGETADHRDPGQWTFFVVPEHDLPAHKSLSMARLQRLAEPVAHQDLRRTIDEAAKRIAAPSPSLRA